MTLGEESVLNHPVELILILLLLSLLPLLVIVSTSFLKFSISLSLLRNALGLQSIPPNMVIYGLSIILTAYVMYPVISHVSDAFVAKKIKLTDDNWILMKLPFLKK